MHACMNTQCIIMYLVVTSDFEEQELNMRTSMSWQ